MSRNIRTKETLATIEKKAIKLLIITLTTMIAVLASAFLFITSENAQDGYALQQEKLKNEELKTKNSNLNTKITKSTAFSHLEDSEIVEDMKTMEEKTFITAEDNK